MVPLVLRRVVAVPSTLTVVHAAVAVADDDEGKVGVVLVVSVVGSSCLLHVDVVAGSGCSRRYCCTGTLEEAEIHSVWVALGD